MSFSVVRCFVPLLLGITFLPCSGFAEDATTALQDSKQSVNPGINERFLDPELDVKEWLERFEVESREVYQARDRVVEALALKPGQTVADIGAGTGFYSLLFQKAVGDDGWVYAVELSQAFAKHLRDSFAERDLENLTTVLCQDDSVCLPPKAIDAAFICDVYHHFEYPLGTMSSLHRAMRTGGKLVVIDFERIPGESREWTLGHVRAGKQTFIDEITEAGFELVADRKIAGFQENYFLEFRKP